MKNSTKTTISVIVPVYKAESFINRTIDNILNQTHKNFELLLVDDGSPDESGRICDEYALKDNRIRVYHTDNSGASNARNFGIDNSTTDFICFVDADDIITNNYLERMIYDYFQDYDVDLVLQGLIKRTGHNDFKYKLIDEIFNVSSSGIKSLFLKIDIAAIAGPCCKLFRRSLLDRFNLRFSDKIIYAEDYDFLIRYIAHSQKIVSSSATNYIYEVHEGSVTMRNYTYTQELSGLCQIGKTYTEFARMYPNKEVIDARNKCIIEYIWRLIFANYKNKYSLTKRVCNLREMPPKYTDIYRISYKASTTFTGIIKFLLVRRLFVALDILLYFRLCK